MTPVLSDTLQMRLRAVLGSVFPEAAVRVGFVTVGGERRLHWHVMMPSGRFANLAQPVVALAGAEEEDAVLEFYNECVQAREDLTS